MTRRVLIQHLSGSRANQEDTFVADAPTELLIGRDAHCNVRYDDSIDDLVSRQHARLKLAPNDQGGLDAILSDQQSANGLLVNGSRVTDTVSLQHGDLVRLGVEGPEFLFKIDPPPESLTKKTRVIARPEPSASVGTKTRLVAPLNPGATPPPVVEPAPAASSKAALPPAAGTARPTVGKPVYIGATIAALLALGLGGWYLAAGRANNTEISMPAPSAGSNSGTAGALSADQVRERYSKSIVKIHVNWSMVHRDTKRPLYQKVDEVRLPNGSVVVAPLYIRKSNGIISPWITDEPKTLEGYNLLPIGGRHSGTGFVATENGHILTNRHVATPWLGQFRGLPGVLYREGDNGQTTLEDANFDGRADVVLGRNESGARIDNGTFSASYQIQFEDNEILFNAVGPALPSDLHDVAMLRVDIPYAVKRVEIKDTYETVRAGEDVVVLGYPGITVPVWKKGTDEGNGTTVLATKYSTSVSKGIISNIQRASNSSNKGTTSTEYSSSDRYQLNINSTGAGNSGGPVFNTRGEVIAIYYAGAQYGGATVSYAVPIRFAMPLLGQSGGK